MLNKIGWLGFVLLGVFAYAYLSFNPINEPKILDPPLKTLAQNNGIELGNHAIYTRIQEPAYKNILVSQHSFVLLDNTPNWHFNGYDLRPAKDKYDFSEMDELVSFAKKNNMEMQAHHLLWGEQKWLPDWLKNGNYSKQELDAIIKDHIYTVAGRYKGQIREWTVINEPFTRAEHLYGLNDWWADNTGSQEYIDKAFIWAHEADPNAKLLINDFNTEYDNKISDAMYDYVKSAKKRGIPIDGAGFQMHIDGSNPPKRQEVVDNFKRFADLGVGVYVTEFDVNMADVKANYNKKAEIEAGIYYDMIKACIDSHVCKSFAFLGITDKETWYNYMGIKQPMPLMFDENYTPKPAYFSVYKALSSN